MRLRSTANNKHGCGVGVAGVSCFRAEPESFLHVLESELESLLFLETKFSAKLGHQGFRIGAAGIAIVLQTCWNRSRKLELFLNFWESESNNFE